MSRAIGQGIVNLNFISVLKLYDAFVTERFAPRKKDRKVDKSHKRSWSQPHQGKREIARRFRQIQRGVIRPSAMVAR